MRRYDELIFDARSASPESVAAAIQANGCVQLKHALDLSILRAVRRKIEASPYAQAPWFQMIQLEDPAAPLDFPLIKAINASLVTAVLRGVFDAQRLMITCLHCFFRCVSRDNSSSSALPFHQDGIGFPAGIPAVTVSVLIDPDRCGRDAPGLQFNPGPRNELLSR